MPQFSVPLNANLLKRKRAPVADQHIRFDDGAAYERVMGTWSRLAGDIFLDWLAPRSGLRWIDIGCGNGAFTELLVEMRTSRGSGDRSVGAAQVCAGTTCDTLGAATVPCDALRE